MSPSPTHAVAPLVGTPVSRIDGPLKVSGRATYTSDMSLPGMLAAVPVGATIAAGKLLSLDASDALAMPGVREVFTRANIGRFERIPEKSKVMMDEKRPPFDDDVIRYYGQYIALVVADTFENATAAARRVHAKYDAAAPNVDMQLSSDETPEVDSERGDAPDAFAKGAVTVDETYRTPTETHSPIELHATLADFDGRTYTIHETSQAIVNARAVIATMLGVPVDDVRVITEYLGSGFGGKLWPWTHTLLAAAASRQLGVPVKLVLSRKASFETVGHRTNTQQRMRLSADADGTLTSLQQDFIQHAARVEKSKEDCGEGTALLYGTPNLRVTSAFARRDIGANTSMRGPGAVPGLFATESAMDELAIKLGMDPVAFRLKNEPDVDPSLDVPFSSRHLAECFEKGAEAFGWSARTPDVGSMTRDGLVVGWGMAGCTWIAKRVPASAAIELRADGTVRLSSAGQDIGTGTYTVLAQLIADVVGVPLEKVDVVLGDTRLPPGPFSGGSMLTASMVPAVMAAARDAFGKLVELASNDASSDAPLQFSAGHVHAEGAEPSTGRTFAEVLAAAKLDHVEGKGSSGASDKDEGAKKISIHSYGAHFVEVTWDAALARLRVSRVVTVIDGGRILNPKTGRNQIEGAVMMGVGMALFEETEYDERSGAPINANMADYVMTTHADAPPVEVHFLDYPDLALNELGARGIGEIGLAGVAPAIAAAVHHATGVRVRSLPIRIEDLIAPPATNAEAG